MHTSHGKKFKSSFVRVRANAGLAHPFWRNARGELICPLRWNANPNLVEEPSTVDFEGEDKTLLYGLIRVKTLLGDQTLDSRALIGANQAKKRRYFGVILLYVFSTF